MITEVHISYIGKYMSQQYNRKYRPLAKGQEFVGVAAIWVYDIHHLALKNMNIEYEIYIFYICCCIIIPI